MRKITAYEIALSAVACAVATLALTLGTLYSPMLFTGYMVACLSVMLPLSGGYFGGASLCFVGASLLTLIFNGFNFWDTMPFLLFFGLHPVVNALQKRRRWNRYLLTVLKAAWFDGAMYLTWRMVFVMNTAIPFVDRYIIPIILIGGTLFFIAYDYLIFRCQDAVNGAVRKYIKRNKK